MTVFIMDTDYYVLKQLEEMLVGSSLPVTAKCFTSANALWDAYETENADVVFVEKEAYFASSLIDKIREKNPCQKIVLVKEEGTLPPDLLNRQLCGILQKPVTAAALEELLFRIRHPLLSKIIAQKTDR